MSPPSSKPRFTPNFVTDSKVSALLPTPLYTQIKGVLREMILAGVYKPHQLIPSESEMIESFQILKIVDLGNIGLNISFDDEHNRGIFPWAYLRELRDVA
jgi:Gamma-butyrobetaine hydroxylase-like, N-terminal/Bacterial regulatory proteins, gntR family